MIRTAWAFVKRDALIAVSYKAAFVMQLLRVLIAIPVLYYMSSLAGDTGQELLSRYGGNFFAFLLIGIGFLDYLHISLKSFNQSLRDGQVTGTLEIMLLAPTRLSLLLVCSSLWVYLFATLRFSMYLIGGLAFGLNLGKCNLPAALFILFIAVISLMSFGILSASVTMVLKRGGFLNGLMAAASTFCSGILFPVEVLPTWLQKVSIYLPATHALEGIRLAIFQGYGLPDLMPQIAILCLFVIVLLPIALISFWLAVRWTKISGTLAHY